MLDRIRQRGQPPPPQESIFEPATVIDDNQQNDQLDAYQMADREDSAACLFNENQEKAEAERFSSKDSITAYQAGWNVTNAIQGMFIVSLPYVVLHGGWWGVVSLLGVAYICYYTGLILVDCLYENGQRVRHSYVDIANDCWGRHIGGKLVGTAQLIELLMTCILYVVLCGDLMDGSFPGNMNNTGWMMCSCIFLLACAFLTNLKAVSALSFGNTISHVIINCVIVFYCLTRIGSWSFSKIRWTLDIDQFPTVHGIVVFSYTSHIFLPTLEGNMVDRSQFKNMLKWSHIAAGAFKGGFAVIGFLTFGNLTQQEVPNNLPHQTFKSTINLILVVKALLSYPLPYYAAVQLIESALFKGKHTSTFPGCFSVDGSMREWAVALRLALVLMVLVMAMCVPFFALLMGLIGSITGCMLSFVWPCLFHLILKKHEISKITKVCDIVIIIIGLVSAVVGVVVSGRSLTRAMQGNVDEYY